MFGVEGSATKEDKYYQASKRWHKENNII